MRKMTDKKAKKIMGGIAIGAVAVVVLCLVVALAFPGKTTGQPGSEEPTNAVTSSRNLQINDNEG